jgi:hypothetical protein
MAYGLHPVKHAGGGNPTRTNVNMDYYIADDYNTAIARGDLVHLLDDGTIAKSIGGEGTPTANNIIVGVFWGVEYTPDTGAYSGVPVIDSVWPASQSISGSYAKAFVIDDPDTVFKVEADQVGTALTQADVFASVDFFWAAHDALTKTSNGYLDSSVTPSTGQQLRILGPADGDGVWTAAGTAMDVLVKFQGNYWQQATAV